MAEKVGVQVDRDFVRVGSKSYAIRQINTVDVQCKNAYSRNAWFWWGLIAAALLIGGVAPTADGKPLGVGYLLLGLPVALIAWHAWTRSKIRDYILVFEMSSRSVQAVTNRDADFIFGLRNKVEAAIAGSPSAPLGSAGEFE